MADAESSEGFDDMAGEAATPGGLNEQSDDKKRRSRCHERSYKRNIVVTFSCVVLRELVEGLSGRLLTPVTQSIAACCSVIEEGGHA
ncbi:uncharacterized protein IUM83_09603 [Phytophthora cinnamomi]|uniref:uncharacterized protein n=1 Tax=Phytophthora cinnamomi TaxID=4785 RepID=UPI00355A4840|nr:hypothetical protein IUM83_09603 [Phytophthora cinnamomi]